MTEKTNKFISKAVDKHGSLFDYSLSNYVSAKTKVDIICNRHGTFSQVPSNHLNGAGCPKCGIEKNGSKRRLDQSAVQEKLNSRGIKLLDTYTTSTAKLTFECSHHHVWAARASHVLHGSGCPVCAKVKRRTTKEFISKAVDKHGSLFDYSLSHYVNARTKLDIICNHHGTFSKTADAHLRGAGCPKCELKTRGVNQRLDHRFVQERLNNRGVKLLDPYTDSHTKLTFECSHGHVWTATPGNVLNGGGCPTCADTNRAQSQKLSTDDINSLIISRGLKLAGTYINQDSPTLFECLNGHNWTTSYRSIRRGSGCPDCSGRITYTNKTVKDLLKQKGITLLTKISKGLDRADFQCVSGHQWSARLSVVVKRTGCPTCFRARAGQSQRLTNDEVTTTLESRGYSMFGAYVNIGEVNEFQCDVGHRWLSNLNRIRSGDGCPTCYGNQPLTVEEVNERIHERSIRLSSNYSNTSSNAIFECENGHSWSTTPANVMKGSGCPGCAEYGFNKSKPAEFYYSRIDSTDDTPTLWMVGITNRTFEERYTAIDHSKMTLLYRLRYDEGKETYAFEQDIIRSNKEYLFNGYSPLTSKGGVISKEIFTIDVLGVEGG